MKIAVGAVLGLFSGFLIYMAVAMLFANKEPSSIFVLTTFLGGWVISTIVLVRGARTLSKVFSRGFLLGAAEWLAMIPVGMVVSGQALTETVDQGSGSGAEVVGADVVGVVVVETAAAVVVVAWATVVVDETGEWTV